MYEGRFFEKTVNGFASCGYNIHFKILKSSDFGIPQIRERVFIFGTKSDKNFQFPSSSNKSLGKLKSFKNVGEAINDLIKKDSSFQNHIILNHSETVVSRYKLIQEGGKLPPPDKLQRN